MMKAKTYNFFLLLFFSFFSVQFFFAQDVVKEKDVWTLGAEPFSFSKKMNVSVSDTSLSNAIPKLILEQFAENLTRTTFSSEISSRKLYDIRQKRLDLFLQLSKEVQSRDALLLNNYSEKTLRSKIKDAEKKIEELKKQLEENLANESEVSKIELSKKENESQESKKNTNEQRLEKTNKNTQKTESILEQVRLYKNDFTSLFVSNQNDKTSALYEKELVSNGINALLSGTILSYEGYISLTVSLVIYPGAKLAGTVTDVDSVSNVHILASRVARSLLPFISNSLPVELVINIEPKEVQDNITFSLDDIVHKSIPENIVVQSGVHSLSFSSPGFQSIGTTYSFSGSKKFLISVNMSSTSDSSFYLRLKNHQDGNIYVSGDSGVKISDDNPIAKITINNQQVLGMFISKEGLPAPFYIDQKLLTSNANLSVNVKTFNRDEYIDKRRRRMYTSYTALVISLMGTFFTYGNVNAASSATVNNWRIANYACIGISSACGAWLIYELVRYLIAADSVLPAKAKKLDVNKIEYNIDSSTSSDSNITNSDSILNDSQLNETIE